MLEAFAYDRYLSAKRTVDDRSLNRHVLEVLREELRAFDRPISTLEIGSGVGSMVRRMVDWRLVATGEFTLVDSDRRLQRVARQELAEWGAANGHVVDLSGDGLRVRGSDGHVDVQVSFIEADAGEYVSRCSRTFDLMVACAVFDLLDARAMLAKLAGAAAPGGLYWLSINFDGETSFHPGHELDRALLDSYHRSMDERARDGGAGDSRSGRNLFGHLASVGASVLASGSSDWVVQPKDRRYPDDERYFLECILRTIERELRDRPDVDQRGLESWLGLRFAELERAELVYKAHQLDFVARAARGP